MAERRVVIRTSVSDQRVSFDEHGLLLVNGLEPHEMEEGGKTTILKHKYVRYDAEIVIRSSISDPTSETFLLRILLV